MVKLINARVMLNRPQRHFWGGFDQMRCYILIPMCLSCWLVASLHAQGDADKGLKELQGKWRAIEMQTGGTPAPKEVLEKARLEIKDDEMTWHSGGPAVRKLRIRLDSSKSPGEIDITMLDGPGKGSTFPGIYALEKGRLRLCYSHTKDRPKDFKTERGEARELVILEREKPSSPRRDQFGDPLPAGAIARLGSARLGDTPARQQNSDLTIVAISSDGRAAALLTREGPVRLWETATGKQSGEIAGNYYSMAARQVTSARPPSWRVD